MLDKKQLAKIEAAEQRVKSALLNFKHVTEMALERHPTPADAEWMQDSLSCIEAAERVLRIDK